MRFLVQPCLARIALLGLSACAPAPGHFVESPVAGAYFQKAVGDASALDVDRVYVCGLNGEWAVTVWFNDDSWYTYGLPDRPAKPELRFYTTAQQRKDMLDHYETPKYGCLDGTQYQFDVKAYLRRFTAKSFGDNLIAGYVHERIVVNDQFDDDTKDVLQRAAVAVHEAAKERSRFQPAAASWGVRP